MRRRGGQQLDGEEGAGAQERRWRLGEVTALRVVLQKRRYFPENTSGAGSSHADDQLPKIAVVSRKKSSPSTSADGPEDHLDDQQAVGKALRPLTQAASAPTQQRAPRADQRPRPASGLQGSAAPSERGRVLLQGPSRKELRPSERRQRGRGLRRPCFRAGRRLADRSPAQPVSFCFKYTAKKK